MSKYPEAVLAKDKKGNSEVRNLVSRGKFVMYDYRSDKTFRQVENKKKKLYLKDENGIVEEYFVIPLKSSDKFLLIVPKSKDEKNRKVWNEKTKKEEDLWK
jgi:hypothetical protein